ncbi:hypothetical protein J4448_04160 [Candidatus Woesearchaeota archaeon]|nr:hypothetical protein [Candidatus Woesearchaeota archaeon]
MIFSGTIKATSLLVDLSPSSAVNSIVAVKLLPSGIKVTKLFSIVTDIFSGVVAA